MTAGSITELMAAHVQARPAALALADASGGRLTYAELELRTSRLAGYLRHKVGGGTDTLVALAVEPTVDLIVAMLGVARAGAAYLPLDPRDPAGRLRTLAMDAGAVLVLADDVRDVWEGLPVLRLAEVLDHALSADADPVPSEALAYVRYTSGSSGRPKGVGITHANLAAYVDQMMKLLAPQPGDVFSMLQPVTFDSSLTMLYPALAAGGTLWVIPPDLATDPQWVAGHLRDARTDFLKITPSHLAALHAADVRADVLMPRKALLLGGEPSRWEWFSGLSGLRPACRVINHYGPTETTVGVSALDGIELAHPAGDGSTPLGPPLAHATLHVLDDLLNPVPAGESGELCVGGLTVGRGYVNRPGLTAASFVPDPMAVTPGARMYRTGDRVRRRADGTFEFIGRLDNQVKIRGFRVEPAEVAHVLAGHPEVADAFVTADAAATGQARLVGYLTARKGAELDTQKLVRHAEAELPGYMVPAALVVLDAFPLNRHGKVDKERLPVPAWDSSGQEQAPLTDVEQTIADLFSELLGLRVTHREAGFFALGGHSLLVAKLLSRLRAAFHVEIPVRAVFEAPTVAALARSVEAARARGDSRLPQVVKVPRTGELPASHGQQRLWFLNQLDPDSPLYNTNFGVRALGEVDLEVLRECVTELVRRHEVLRTRLVPGADGLLQHIEPAPRIPYTFADLSGEPEAGREEELRRLIAAHTERPFDLKAEIPIRVLVTRLSDDEHLLLLTMHHVATEGPSMRILHRELGLLYRALRNGGGPALEPPQVQYADFAVWQRELLARGAYARQLEFWRERLTGLPARVELRTDLPRPPEVSPAGSRVRFDLSGALTGRLRAFATAENATLFMILLAGFHLVLAERTEQRDVAVGIPVAFRPRPELEGTVGFFGNTLVLRTDVDRDLSFRALLGRIRTATLDAVAHRDLPFEALVEEIRPRRRLGDTPLVNIMMMVAEEQRPPIVLDEVTFQAEPIDTGTAKAELVALFEVVDDGLAGELEFRTDLFTAEGVAPLAARFEEVFAAVLDDPDAPISHFLPSGTGSFALPETDGGEPVQEYVAPRTDLERELCALWIDLIGNDDIGIADRFFDIGGHSLLAARVVGWIAERYGVSIPLRWCFDQPTVESLALAVLAAQLDELDEGADLLDAVDGGDDAA
ncbi:non-ribosomal peptide synthetase [Nonomuraea aurantiaca]|uniref:non-ribosomal peptide synthetase n=1 Tax=Nonomuraea aurantiaca TaxID=2878562 RepID=UPI001CD95561|nr:non-ribosomal peptide synthetase [Nonomuraea aurantiaca]MCA2230007.1 amino acid adenylation domain-containing protein [Nonomuraea aurantiaca]